MTDAIEVAVAVLRRSDGRVLIAERAAWRHQGGHLEFPGGKVDPGESTADALGRELEEELGIRPLQWKPLMRVRHRYEERDVVLHACLVEHWSGEPRAMEDQPLDWLHPGDLAHERFPAANRPILAALQYPDRCLVTPTPRESTLEEVLTGVERAIMAGADLIQLRAPDLSAVSWRRFLEETCRIARAAPARVRLLANSDDPEWLQHFPALAGLHLGAEAARHFSRRPIPADRILSCACHDPEEIRQAERLEADLILLGSVGPTPTHAGHSPLGWEGLETLTATTVLPAYAIGGMRVEDIPRVRERGAIGIAAIRGLWPER